MTYTQNHTLLGSLQDYSQALQDLHAASLEGAPSGLQTHLAGYMEDLQASVSELLQLIQKDLSGAEAQTFSQYTLNTHPLEELDNHLPMPAKPVERIEWLLQRQQYMAQWCRGIASQSISARTTELFGQIADRIRELNRQFATGTNPYTQEAGQRSAG